MQEADFAELAQGRLVRNLQGDLAFLPNNLPPLLQWSAELASACSVADRAFARLHGIGSLRHINPRLLMRPFLRREAVLSSQIEGTQATFSDLLFFEETRPNDSPETDVREVFNYVSALEFALEAIQHRPITLSLIRELHSLLMIGIRGGDQTPSASVDSRYSSADPTA